MKQAIIIGSGFSGAVCARTLAEQGYQIQVIERRNHIGGNMYDYPNSEGIIIQQYGPHIFHTNMERVITFLSKFTSWFPYEHRVLGQIDGQLVPIPFNLRSLELLYPEKEASYIKDILVQEVGMGKKVPILELKKHRDSQIRAFADYVYEKVFYHYTVKQWGMTPEQLSPSVMNRVPVYVSYEDRYFLDQFQMMPVDGFTPLFTSMLAHPNIQISLECDAKEYLSFDYQHHKVLWNGKEINGPIIYTGAIDELMDYQLGKLPYRTLRFKLENHPLSSFQPVAVVNYPNTEEYTRISEFTKFTSEKLLNSTVTMKEYPSSWKTGDIPYYPIEIEPNLQLHKSYLALLEPFQNFYPLGRLAAYKYINMDAAVLFALQLCDQIIKQAQD